MSANDFVQRGRTLVDRGKYSEAVRVCRLGLLANPTDVDGRIVLATALLSLRRYDEVLAEMRVALEVDSNNVNALGLRGEALLRKGEDGQAVEVFEKALAVDPNNAHIRQLNDQAKSSMTRTDNAAAASSFADHLDQMTKHYPTHRGVDSLGTPASGQVTKPTSAGGGNVRTPAPEELAVGDGTMELDPDLEGVEILDDDPVADPPTGRHGHAAIDRTDSEDIMTLDPDDLIEETSGAVELPRQPVSPAGLAGHGSVAMGRGRPTVEEPTVRARRPLGRGRDYATGIGTSPESPLSKSGFASGTEAEQSAAAIDALFPDDEGGVSQVELVPPPGIAEALGSNAPERLPARPGQRVRSQSEDMRTIRAGLGMGGRHGTGERVAARSKKARRVEAPRTSQLPKAKRSNRDERTETISKAHKRRRSKVRAGTHTVSGGGRRMLMIYGIVAVVVIGAAVFAGLEIRHIRLEREIRSVRSKAVKYASTDTYKGYIKARRAYANIVKVKNSTATRARLAHMDAAIAAEFGQKLERAENSVARVKGSSNIDAEAARAYLAIAKQDVAEARKLADAFIADHPDEPLGYYFRGRAALLERHPAKAVAHFRKALDVSKQQSKPRRPLYWIGLGRAQAAAGKAAAAKLSFDEALRAEPSHPTAMLHRARAIIDTRPLPDSAQSLERVLEDLIAEAKKPITEQKLGVSPQQAGWAVLSLAELDLARGDKRTAKRNLARETQWRPRNNWVFSEHLAKAYFEVGEMDKARKVINKLLGKGSGRDLQVLLARMELNRKKPKAALHALANAGDLSKRPDALALRGRARLALGKLDDAIADLDSALAQKTDLPHARTARAKAYGRKLNQAKAAGGSALKDLAKRLSELTKSDDSLALAIVNAAVLRLSGELGKARKVINAVIGKLGNKPPVGMAYLERARLNRSRGLYSKATRDYASAIEKLDDAVDARLETATLLIDTGNAAGALEALAALAKDAPDNAQVLLQLGRAQTLNGKVEAGKTTLDKAAAASGAQPWLVARERGRNAARRGDIPGAIALYEKAIQLNPDDAETRLLLMDLYALTEKKAKVKEAQAKIKSRAAFSGRAVVQQAIGRYAMQRADYKDALRAFGKALALLKKEKAPPRTLAAVTLRLGRAYLYKGKYRPAYKEMLRARRLDPYNSEVHADMGLYFLERKNWRAAIKATKRATVLNPGDANTWFNLGDAYVKVRMRKQARKAYKKVLELVSDGDLAMSAKDALKSL